MARIPENWQHPIEPWMVAETQYLRTNAAHWLVDLIKDRGLVKNIADVSGASRYVKPLVDGTLAACFIINDEQDSKVLKFRSEGVMAEASMMSLWREKGVRVPAIYEYDIVPATKHLQTPYKYILMESILGEDGAPAMDGYKLLDGAPELASSLGKFMGEQLSLIHAIPVDENTYYGYQLDSVGPLPASVTWKGSLLESFIETSNHLRDLQFSDNDITRLFNRITATTTTEDKSYLHGDFHPGSVLIRSSQPLDAYIIDPHPLVGHVAWDYAKGKNKIERNKIMRDMQVSTELIKDWETDYYTSFFKTYEQKGRQVDPGMVLSTQIVRNLVYYDWLKSGDKFPEMVPVAASQIMDQVSRLHTHNSMPKTIFFN